MEAVQGVAPQSQVWAAQVADGAAHSDAVQQTSAALRTPALAEQMRQHLRTSGIWF